MCHTRAGSRSDAKIQFGHIWPRSCGGKFFHCALCDRQIASAAQPSHLYERDHRCDDTGAGSVAFQNLLALNVGMFELYGEAGQLVQGSILAQHPVILGLFSGAGGRFILYRPGSPPLEGPPVPEVYQLLKSIGHSVMALGVVVGPHIGKPDDQSWRPSLASYRVRLKAALDSLDATSMPAEWRENNHALIRENIAFIDKCDGRRGDFVRGGAGVRRRGRRIR